MLKEKIPLLENEIANYKQIDSLKNKIDLVRVETINNLNIQVSDLSTKVEKQKKGIRWRNWGIGGCVVVICLLIL